MQVTGLNTGKVGQKKDALLASKIYKSVNASCNLNVLVKIKVFKVFSALRDKNPRRVGRAMLLVLTNSNQRSKKLASCPKLTTDCLHGPGKTTASNWAVWKETHQNCDKAMSRHALLWVQRDLWALTVHGCEFTHPLMKGEHFGSDSHSIWKTHGKACLTSCS